MSFHKNDNGRNYVPRPPTKRDDDVTRGDGARRRRDAGRRVDDGAATMERGGSDGRSTRRNMIVNHDSFQRSRSTSRSRSQHHVPPHEYISRSTATVGSSGAPPPRKRNELFRASSLSGCNGGPKGRSLSAIRAASNGQSRHEEGTGRSLSRLTRPISYDEKLILIDDRGRRLPRSRSRSHLREVKESKSEPKSTQDESCINDKGLSPSRRISSTQITENHYRHSRGRSGSRGRSKSLQSNDATPAFVSTSMANACRLAPFRKFVVEIGENNEIVQVFEFSENGTLPPPDVGAIPDKARSESASLKCGGTNGDCEGTARRVTENGTASPYSSSPPIIKTSRVNSQEAIATSFFTSSRQALSSLSRSSLRGSQGNLSQASVSFAMDSDGTSKNVGLDVSTRSCDSYYRRSFDISARSDDSHYLRSPVSSMSDHALEISEGSSESNSRRAVRFVTDQQGDRQPDPSNDTNARRIGRSSTTTVASKDRSASPRLHHALSSFVDFDPAASSTKSRQSLTVPSPTHDHIHLRRAKGLLGYEKSSLKKSMSTESTEEMYSISPLTADMSIATNHTSGAVAEDEVILFSTLNLESDSCDDSSILSYPTAFMDKLASTRVQGRTAKDDGAIAQTSKVESRIGTILSLKVSSSKRRTESKVNNPRDTTDTWNRDPNSVSVTQNSLTCNQSYACDHETQDYESQKLRLPKFFRR